MKKLLVILLLLGASVLWAAEAEEETVGDASGNDLEPVLKGLSSTMSGGMFVIFGNAADYSDPIGSVVNLAFGYDIQIVDAFSLGIHGKFGILQLNTDSSLSVSPWVEDYAPVLAGLSISPTYCINKRWEIGLDVGADFLLMGKAKDVDGKETDMFIMIGAGIDAEYYTFARHFSIGMTVKFDYILSFDGMGLTVMPYMKYSFGI